MKVKLSQSNIYMKILIKSIYDEQLDWLYS